MYQSTELSKISAPQSLMQQAKSNIKPILGQKYNRYNTERADVEQHHE